MKRLMLIAVVLVFSIRATSGHRCQLADSRIERLIAAKAKSEKSAEYCQYRRYDALDDIDRDGKPDFIVTFNLEVLGANHTASYLFVFLSTAGEKAAPLEAAVGETGTFAPDAIGVEDHRIVMETQEWRYGDAMCCPSGRGKRFLVLDHGKIRLLASS